MPETPILEVKSTLTESYQTTIPDSVRKILGLNKHDRICYTIELDGRVILSRSEPPENDPVLGKFLAFLEKDLIKNPHQISVISSDLRDRVKSVIADVELDLNAPLADEDE
jgi:antitoxin PrlF